MSVIGKNIAELYIELFCRARFTKDTFKMCLLLFYYHRLCVMRTIREKKKTLFVSEKKHIFSF